MLTRCPACDAASPEPFFSLPGLPVHGTAVLPDPQQARSVPVGDQVLVLCERCGLVFNRSFDERLLDYTGHHEESQHHSPRFAAYAEEITKDWLSRFDLAGRDLVEIGCGSGDFAATLLAAGAGRVTGIDPHFTPERIPADLAGRLRAVPEFFAASMIEPGTAAVVCRHTLEHIPALAMFGSEVVAGMRHGGVPLLLAEVPDLGRILDEGAFWDLQYEHCSYFTPATLAGFLTGLGFADPAVRSTYSDQYIVGEARLGTRRVEPVALPGDQLRALRDACRSFADRVEQQIGRWRVWLGERAAEGDPAVVWGGGAKGLTFLNVVVGQADRPDDMVQAVVDINPGLQGHYMGGLGLPICSPDDLVQRRPRTVLLMNPVYLGEVREMLDARGLTSTELLAV
ncbi:methyltransferase domain-containing protein [Pseudonocardia hispaniensis]|uniref:Methyltransferase domain-containing protein n=1 Tax=Pseudonocardia hispaniensis TaxID=904933 RepID=A0ABW1J622_9PSEU